MRGLFCGPVNAAYSATVLRVLWSATMKTMILYACRRSDFETSSEIAVGGS